MGVEWGGEGEGEADRKELKYEALHKTRSKMTDDRLYVRAPPTTIDLNRYNDNEPITNSNKPQTTSSNHMMSTVDDLTFPSTVHYTICFLFDARYRSTTHAALWYPHRPAGMSISPAKYTTSVRCRPAEQRRSWVLP